MLTDRFRTEVTSLQEHIAKIHELQEIAFQDLIAKTSEISKQEEWDKQVILEHDGKINAILAEVRTLATERQDRDLFLDL